MVDVVGVCAHIIRLSTRHEVEPLAVVGLLAVHALVDTDFRQLRIWMNVAAEMHHAQPA